jgi:biopolymer transport protein ExbB
MDASLGWLTTTWMQAVDIWKQGGPAMVAIAVIALVMFAVGMNIHLKLRRTGFRSVPERTWRRWLDRPEERRGAIGRLIDEVMGVRTLHATTKLFEHLRRTETVPFERDLRVMKVCVSAAPLVGLLGTVTGMLATFGALSSGSGGDKTMGMIAGGISEALITTETGLVVALPGLFFQYQLGRQFERYKAFLTHLETVCTQVVYRRQGGARRNDVHRAAAAQVARALLRRAREPQVAPPQPPTPPKPSPALQTTSR